MRLPSTLAPVRSNVSRAISFVAPFLATLAELRVLPEEPQREDPLLQFHPLLPHQVPKGLAGAMNPSSDIDTLKNTFPSISPPLPSERSR